MTVKPIDGQPSSADVRAQLAASGKPVLLAFSRGKDSIATWLALKDAGVRDIIPYHMHTTPGLPLVEQDLVRWRELLGVGIIDFAHPSHLARLNAFMMQPASWAPTLITAGIPDFTYEELVSMLREQLGVPDAWVADGVRAADSPQRRVSMATHGVMRPKHRKVSPIWDWTKAEVMDRIAAEGWSVGRDYDLFKRSLDGIDFRFIEPMRRESPADFEAVKAWHPMVDAEILRHGLLTEALQEVREQGGSGSWQERKRAEAKRYAMQTDGEFYLVLDFDSAASRQAAGDLVGADGQFVAGPQFAEALGVKPGVGGGFGKPKLVSGKTAGQRRAESAWLRKLPKAPNPFTRVRYADQPDLAADLGAELRAVADALPPAGDDWLCVYFATRRHKLDFLASARWGMYGERFIPGEKVMRSRIAS